MNKFRENILLRDRFLFTYELVPARGSRGVAIESILKFAEEAKKIELVDAVSLTDNAGGGPACSPDILAREIQEKGMDTIVHFSAKDANRNSLEARALSLDKCGIENLLVLSGDYPINCHEGLAKPVFDLDSTQLLDYLKRMNQGLKINGQDCKSALSGNTDFFLGCAVSPFKTTKPELMMQYFKLEKKIRAGADYIICQLGFDTRKYKELLRFIEEKGFSIPVIASVFVLRRGVGRTMHRGDIPGCVVTDELLEKLDSDFQLPDKGKGASLERAARQISILKGIGYNGAHIEGFGLSFEDIRCIIERAKEIGDNWVEYDEDYNYSPPGNYFLFEDVNGYKIPKPIFRPRRSNFLYQITRVFHHMFFRKNTAVYNFMSGFMKFLEKRPLIFGGYSILEHSAKVLLFDCRNCGDCALPDMFYLCPESQCPKYQRVGPCGGSRNGLCEVHNDRFCMWYHIYLRASMTNRLEELRKYFIPPRNWELNNTSSWANFFTGRDHSGKALPYQNNTVEQPVLKEVNADG